LRREAAEMSKVYCDECKGRCLQRSDGVWWCPDCEGAEDAQKRIAELEDVIERVREWRRTCPFHSSGADEDLRRLDAILDGKGGR
jgi:uncharacterized Zn finger protein (UPF0148 family)